MTFPVVRSLDDVQKLSPTCSAVTLGVFDGVHLGHRKIIDELVTFRGDPRIDRIFLMTFDPHPVVVTRSRETPPVLSTIEERLELLDGCGLDGVFVVPFDKTTSRMDYRDFIQRYLLEALDMKQLVLGYDCRFGYRREGSPERAAAVGEEWGFGVRVVPPVEVGGAVVSSTYIRDILLAGRLEEANGLLGHPYLIAGTVVTGSGKGADLGFPTANIGIAEPLKLWPPEGVYAVRVDWRGRRYDGMMNVGRAPTIKQGGREIEVHIFDFGNTLYGERLSIRCEAWLRPERRFPSVDALVDQLAEDRRQAQAALGAS